LLHGYDRARQIRLEDIVKISKGTQGLTIHKLTGKNPTLKMNAQVTELLKICIQ